MRISTSGKLFAVLLACFTGLIFFASWWERRLFPSLFGVLNDSSRQVLTKTLFYVGGQPVRVWFLIKTILFLLCLAFLARFSRYLIQLSARNNINLQGHRQYLVSRIASFFIYLIGILIGIHVEKISIGTLVILGGTLGVAIGFGLQSLVSNLIAGFILLIEQPIRIGDFVEFGNRSGEVVRIGTRSSWLKTSDNAIVFIPNSEFVTKEFVNWTACDPKIRFSISISVAHQSNIEQVIQMLLLLAREHEDVLSEPAPEVLLTNLGQSSITFTLRVWTLTGSNDLVRLRSDVYLQTLRRFEAAKIDLPFPLLDFHWNRNDS
jgi:small-conductance mechanosensitive channel